MITTTDDDDEEDEDEDDSTRQHLVKAGSGLWVTQQRFGSEDDQLEGQTGSVTRKKIKVIKQQYRSPFTKGQNLHQELQLCSDFHSNL